MSLPEGFSQAAALSLQSALKSAIQVVYQLEDSELAVEPMPTRDDPGSLLFFEAAEGGAGVLGRLVEEREALPAVAAEALRICHFGTEDEDGAGATGENACGKACYDCLLSYANQKDHPILDRHSIRECLVSLTRAEVEPSPTADDPREHFRKLLAACDSDLERRFLQFLDDRALFLPTRSQRAIEGFSARPDFQYGDTVLVFIDGPAHDDPGRRRTDADQEARLEAGGYVVIRFRYDSDWEATVKSYPSVFGVPR